MKIVGLLLSCALAAFAAGETVFIHTADVYPVSGPMMKGVSVLIENGKIADIGPKLVAPKGVRTIEGKGLRVYPGLIDSNTELGLSEVSAERVSVDTGEIGEFMPQLRALIAVNPDSEHFGVVRVNGITSAMMFFSMKAPGARALRRSRTTPRRPCRRRCTW
jgi:imidazolonepropionase-like amidohydrolase